LTLKELPMPSLHDFSARSIAGQDQPLSQFDGQVVLVVNTASACGFTPQFAGLQKLHEQFAGRGFSVIGFPCNQFGSQDPGSDGEILGFCQKNYGVSFPMMSKVEVNGADAHPLFKWLTGAAPGFMGTEAIKWNFTKFLVGKDGQVIKRYGSVDRPEAIARDVEAALAA
jgi:glutathione peroxidase